MKKSHFPVVFSLIFLLPITFGLFTVCEQKSEDALETPSAELDAAVGELLKGAFDVGLPDNRWDILVGGLTPAPGFAVTRSFSPDDAVNGNWFGTVTYTFTNLILGGVTVNGSLTFETDLENWAGSSAITGTLSVTGHPTIQSISSDMTVSGDMKGSEPPAVTGRITVNGTDYDASEFHIFD